MDPFIADYVRLRDDALGHFTARGVVQVSEWGITSDGRPSLRLTLFLVAEMDRALQQAREGLHKQGFNTFCKDRTIHVSLPIEPRTSPVLRIAGQGVPLAGVRRLCIDYGPLGLIDLTGDQAREAITAIRSGREIQPRPAGGLPWGS